MNKASSQTQNSFEADQKNSVKTAFYALIERDIKVSLSKGQTPWAPLVYVLCVVTLLPFALGPDLNILGRFSGALLWIATLLSVSLQLDHIWQTDDADGTLDLCLTSSIPLEGLCVAKIITNWLLAGLPLSIAAPVFGLFLHMTPITMALTVLGLAMGSFGLMAQVVLAASLTRRLKSNALLSLLLILPLSLPTLIFGVSMLDETKAWTSSFAGLTSLVLISGLTSVLGSAAALRSSRS